MEATPEQLIGLSVVGPEGHPLGIVVDVGLFNGYQPKFLLVKAPQERQLLRVEVVDVAEVTPGEVRLLMPRNAGVLPA